MKRFFSGTLKMADKRVSFKVEGVVQGKQFLTENTQWHTDGLGVNFRYIATP
jgi:hypothetical protein